MTDHGYDAGMISPRDDTESGPVARIVHGLGAVMSLALLAGIGFWSYQLIARDVSGIPVVRAMDGPMRVAPEDPGGRLADHQGLAVNRIAGEGRAEPPAEAVTLAPPPDGLDAEDVAYRALRPDVAPDVAPVTERDVTIPPDSPLAQSARDGVTAMVESLSRNAPENATTDSLPANAGRGLTRSLRPQARVASLTAGPTAQATRSGAPAVSEIPADSIEAGTRLVQIGAFDSPETARAQWDRLAARFGAYLEDKERVIQEARSGGRTFYRLRAHGFADVAEARRFCSAFVAEGVDCIPVAVR